jgi:hypothetical protein
MDGGGRSRREHAIESNAGAIAECVPFGADLAKSLRDYRNRFEFE